MDFEAFETDVWDNVNESLFTAQWGNLDDSDPDVETTDIVVTIGETWQGTLYGAESNAFGQRSVYTFETESAQKEWFHGVTMGR